MWATLRISIQPLYQLFQRTQTAFAGGIGQVPNVLGGIHFGRIQTVRDGLESEPIDLDRWIEGSRLDETSLVELRVDEGNVEAS